MIEIEGDMIVALNSYCEHRCKREDLRKTCDYVNINGNKDCPIDDITNQIMLQLLGKIQIEL